MRIACRYALDMPKMVQVRNVPDDLHRTLKARAAMAGTSLSEYLLRELTRLAERPTREELRRRLEQREPVHLTISPADLLAEGRSQR
jgi:antitoxin FitA